MSQNLLEGLNEEQLKAVMHTDGPLMIIAGAGTGKTTVVTQRIAWLIEQGHAKPDEVLALTFTDKAAGEMEERVDDLLPIGYLDLWISTFHAFCERILREHALEIGVPHEFKLMAGVDILLLMRRNFDKFELDYYKPRGNPTRFLKALLQHFSRIKDEMITPDKYLEFANSLKERDVGGASVTDPVNGTVGAIHELPDEIKRIKEIAKAYKVYQEVLLKNNGLDFADLIAYTIELLQKRPNIRKKYQEQFKYVLVDEFQDTNNAQYELVKLLVNKDQNLTVVGDDDQSIYKFRGASLSNIMQFREDYPKAESVVLIKNYRSKAEILDSSYTLIQQNNPHRLEIKENINKKLIAHHEGEGIVEHHHLDSLDEEVRVTLQKIIDLKTAEKCRWSDFCILARANSSAEPFTLSMDRAGMPYRFMAMSGLYMKPLIIDAVSWMRVIDQPHESPSLYRLLSHPQLGIAEADVAKLTLFARKNAISLKDACTTTGLILNFGDESNKRVLEILETLSKLSKQAKRSPVGEMFLEVMKQTGLLANVRMLPEFEQMEQFALLNQFADRLKKFEQSNDDKTLHHFLSEFDHEREAGEIGSLKGDPEAGPDVINVMTIHASKGLEFKYVFIVNMVEQKFPSSRRGDPIPIPDGLTDFEAGDKEAHIAEERRLFYVAITRAKLGVFLMSAEDYGGTRKRKPSRFLQDLQIEPRVNAEKPDDGIDGNTHEKKTSELKYELPASISFTQIAAFTSCPLQYKFAHILKVPVFGRHSLSFGKSMHNTLQRFTETIKAENRLPSKDELLEMYSAAWIDEWYPSPEVKVEYLEKGRESLLDYQKSLVGNVPEITHIEAGFTLKMGEVVIRGRIDRIDKDGDGYEIIDYKTGKPKDKLTWQDKRQLILYQMAAEQCFDPPLKINKLTYHYLEDNSIVNFECKEKDQLKLQDEILGTVIDIKESGFGAAPGFHCKYCDFKDICEFSEA